MYDNAFEYAPGKSVPGYAGCELHHIRGKRRLGYDGAAFEDMRFDMSRMK